MGIIEGFYGPPWSWAERTEVARWCATRGMTHYVYAPKDDPLHRERWREPYGDEELDRFEAFAVEGGLALGFALSPGLSIDYDAAGDRDDLWAKVAAVVERGVTLVVLALDDIPDRPGLGHDHARITASLHDRLDGAARLALVPTQYLGTRSTDHLAALAAGVPDDVPIAWTGRSVVNDELTVADAEARAAALGGRPPLVWDNFPVNDATMADRLVLGPLRGRDTGLPTVCSGWLANPMVQPRASLLPLASVAAFLRGEDPVTAWAQEADQLGWRDFAEACDGVEPNRLVAEAVAALDGPHWTKEAAALAAWLEGAAQVHAPGLEVEAGPWLEQLGVEVALARRALRLLTATRPALRVDADGGGRAAAVDADSVLAAAYAVGAAWPPVRRGSASVLGPRCSMRPVIAQRRDGGWRMGADPVSEDDNAVDALVRAALAAAAAVDVGQLKLTVDGEAVDLDDDGSFRIPAQWMESGTAVVATWGSVSTGGTPPLEPPMPERRLR